MEAAPFIAERPYSPLRSVCPAQSTFGGCAVHFVLKYGLDGLNEARLTELLTFANAAAAIITTRRGALCVMPEAEEVLSLVNSR